MRSVSDSTRLTPRAVHVLTYPFVLFLVCSLISCKRPASRPTESVRETQASFTLTATGLARAYADDEIAADRRYKGKVIYLTGQVENVESDLMDSYLVRLRTGVNWGDLVSCRFPKAQEQHLTRLIQGSYVRIKGRCVGKTPALMIQECILVDEKGSPLGG